MKESQIPIQLATENLNIRKYKEDDAERYYFMSIKNKHHLKRYESENPIMDIKSENDAKKLIKYFSFLWDEGNHYFLGVFKRKTQKFVGQIYVGKITNKLNQYTLGFFVDVDQEGKGFITESVKELKKMFFGEVNAIKITAECDETNIKSINVLERCGFSKVSHMHKNNSDHSYKGTFYYELTR